MEVLEEPWGHVGVMCGFQGHPSGVYERGGLQNGGAIGTYGLCRD